MVTGHYGTGIYGIHPYGSAAGLLQVVSADSLDGFRVEVFFSADVNPNADYFNPANYVFTDLLGAPVTATSVALGVPGSLGPLSAIVTHSGTTLGGAYRITVANVIGATGATLDPTANYADFLALGDSPTFTVVPTSGNELLFTYSQDMLTEAQYTPGIEALTSYVFTHVPSSYPIGITPLLVDHPYTGNLTLAQMDILGMTSLLYTCEVSPSDAILYDGTYLPNMGTGFTAVELGTGSTASTGTHITLTKNLGDIYGWGFIDTSGKITATSSNRFDLVIDPTTALYTPPLGNGVLGAFSLSDGTIQIDISLERVAGNDVIVITSGAFSQQISIPWSTGKHTFTVIRNQKAGFYAFLFDGAPVYTDLIASFTGAATILAGQPGAQFVLATTYQALGFSFWGLSFLASDSTLYGSTWNFMHGVTAADLSAPPDNEYSFYGIGAAARDYFYTEYGPLVKDWGDATPATVNDVHVYLNSVEIDIAEVNPYIGKITLAIPIPLMPAGTNTIEVDYQWMANPIMEMVGLNTLGLVLNKWDRRNGYDYPPNHGEQIQTLPDFPKGGSDETRFPFNVALAPAVVNPQPLYIGHRYLGFERAYTASLNNPTTLLLNQNPHAVAVEGFELTPPGVSETFEGDRSPIQSDPSWILEGLDTGSADPVGGVYTLIDDSSGSYDVGQSALYYRYTDVSYPSSVVVSGRFEILEFMPDGIFTGVGFGVHDNRRLFYAGALYINDLAHFGLLKNGDRPYDRESWEIGPRADIEILDNKTFRVSTDDLPSLIKDYDRFQIFEGSQAGVYTIENLTALAGGTTEVTLDTSVSTFPADPSLYGNRYPTVYFETIWARTATYRLLIDPDQGTAQFFVGGDLGGLAITMTDPPAVAEPAQSVLQLKTDGGGQVMWGSISRWATNKSVWSFVRYGVVPDQTTFHSRGFLVQAEMSALPEDDPTGNEWFHTQDFGVAEIDSSGQMLLLKSNAESADQSIDLSYGYGRVEPFLKPSANVDLDTRFRVEDGVLGAGDLQVSIRNTEKEARLANLIYTETPSATIYRKLIKMPVLSLSGLYTPVGDGWTQTGLFTTTEEVRGHLLTVDQQLLTNGVSWKSLDLTDMDFTDEGNRLLEARFAVKSYTANTVGWIGVMFGADVGLGGMARRVGVALKAPVGGNPAKVSLITLNANFDYLWTAWEYDFDWTDGEQHTYKINLAYTSSAVSVVIDDVVQLPVVNVGLFNLVPTPHVAFMGNFGSDVESFTEWDALAFSVQPPLAAKRTLGVWLGSDPDDIDSWEMPRTDATTEPNSSIQAVVEEMDWRDYMAVTIRWDSEWGVSVVRPDLPAPPYYTGDFATESIVPSAGWINVEQQFLPYTPGSFSTVRFGALDPRSVTQQRWDYVRYRVYSNPSDDFLSPRFMVLNQYNMISSGELVEDVTPESVTVQSLSSRSVTLIPTQLFADRIFKVIDGTTIYSSDQFTFDQESQTIFLDTPFEFSGEHVPVEVVFAPGKPVTCTYLNEQPLWDSITLLNEGTPPFPKHQTADSEEIIASGSPLNDPLNPLNNPIFILNDPFKVLSFEDTEDSLYDSMLFCEKDNGGERDLISTFCDSPAPEHGFAALGIEGPLLTEQNVARPWDNPLSFPDVIRASGGGYVDGVLGPMLPPGSEIMYPNQQAAGVPFGAMAMGLNQQVQIVMKIGGTVVLKKDF